MELKTLQKELHRLDQLVGVWRDAADITTLERDLVLARLRDIYEAVLFGLEATAPEEVAPQAVAVAAPVVEMPEAEAETIEEPLEEPLVFEGDDFFSLDAILPVEEEFAPMEEMPTEEVAPVEEEVASEVVEEPIAEPAAEEPMAFEEEVEEVAPVVEEVVEEVAPAVEETPVVEEQTEEVAPVVEEVAPVVEEPKVEPTPAPATFQTLFGAEPEVDQHRRKQRVIMSLYDVQEPEPKPAVKPEPAPIVVEEPAEEPTVTPDEEEHYTPLATPIEETELTDEDVVFELSEGELEEVVEEPTVETKIDEPTQPIEEPKVVAPVVEEPTVVLGEKLQPQTTLGDQLAARQTVNDLRPRITDLRRAVGLNDKFLLIRDLFNGNGSLYEITIRKLNEFDNFDDCMIYIAEHFAWNPNSDGAKLMMDLLERKFEQQ